MTKRTVNVTLPLGILLLIAMVAPAGIWPESSLLQMVGLLGGIVFLLGWAALVVWGVIHSARNRDLGSLARGVWWFFFLVGGPLVVWLYANRELPA